MTLTLSFVQALLNVDALAKVMIGLIGFVAVIVGLFATRYMQGDRYYRSFFMRFWVLILTVIIMVSADNLWLLLASWAMSNLLFVRLMIHKSHWQPARASGWLAAKTFILGFVCLAGAFILVESQTGLSSIQLIVATGTPQNGFITCALVLLVIAAMTQSAIWPFHRWLLSSVNSPTPVSAIMHAGLVNGGGFILARFAPLYFSHTNILTVLFILGLVTALVGTLWKLMQHDIKRMLACSTMAQMGFMVLQCGLGLFPAAVTHLCWHGLFKANLFLGFNRTIQEKRLHNDAPINLMLFGVAFFCGATASCLFAFIVYGDWFATDTTLVLQILVFIAATQFALIMFKHASWKYFTIALTVTCLVAVLYGVNIKAAELVFASLNIFQPQRLNIFHWLGILLLATGWLIMLLNRTLFPNERSEHLLSFYVKALNAGQPHPDTITTHRHQYK